MPRRHSPYRRPLVRPDVEPQATELAPGGIVPSIEGETRWNGVGAVATPTFTFPLELGGLAREILSAGAGVTVIVFDRDLRVRLAEGDEFRRLGLDITSIKGRVLPEVLSAASWAKLKDPYEGALAGRVSTFDFSSREGVVYFNPRVPAERRPSGRGRARARA